MSTQPIGFIDGRPIYPISGAGGGPGGGEGGTDFGGPADPTGPGGPGDHEGQGGDGYGGGGTGPGGPGDHEGQGGPGYGGPGPGPTGAPSNDDDSDDEVTNEFDNEIGPPAEAPPGTPVDDGRASKAGATANPNTHAMGGTPVALETGITDKGKFTRGAGKTVTGLLGVASGTPPGILGGGASVVSGFKDMKDSIGPVPGSASVSGGNTGIHDGKSGGGLTGSERDPGDVGLEGGVETGVLSPAPAGKPIIDAVGDVIGDIGGAGGHGGPSLPSLPPPPSVPSVPAPPKFPNPNNVTGGGPAMRGTRKKIEDARKFGRQSTILTGGEGLPDLGPVERPGLTGPPQEPLVMPPAAGGDLPREGTRSGRGAGRGEGTRIRSAHSEEIERLDQIEARRFDLKGEFDLIEASNVKQGTTGASSEASSTTPPDLPDGWSLERPYTTLPFDVVRDPNGKLWIRDRRTGELAEDQLLSTQPIDPREGRRRRAAR